MWQRISLGVFASAAILLGQAVQNPTLTGEASHSKDIAEKNPFNTEADLEQGAALFQLHCTYCHGAHGEGGRGADLTTGEYRMGNKDPDLFRTIRNGIPGTEMPSERGSDAEVWKLVAYVRRVGSRGLAEKATGDAAAGKTIYAKSGCASCHRIEDAGTDLGPDLSDIGRRRGLKYLEESIVTPDAYVPNAFRAVIVVLKSGSTVSGIRLNEDDLSVQLRDMSGYPQSFLKADIKEIRRDKPSLMPPYERFDKKDLGDLVTYLNSLKGEQ
jgi:putative heme-binding domain-containing protein